METPVTSRVKACFWRKCLKNIPKGYCKTRSAQKAAKATSGGMNLAEDLRCKLVYLPARMVGHVISIP